MAFVSGALVLWFDDLKQPWPRPVFSLWLGLVAWAALAGYRVISMLTDVLREAKTG